MKFLQELQALNESKKMHRAGLMFGFENSSNATKATKALKAAGINFGRSDDNGIHYFDFDTRADLNKAIKIVTSVIDASLEQEWPVK